MTRGKSYSEKPLLQSLTVEERRLKIQRSMEDSLPDGYSEGEGGETEKEWER